MFESRNSVIFQWVSYDLIRLVGVLFVSVLSSKPSIYGKSSECVYYIRKMCNDIHKVFEPTVT